MFPLISCRVIHDFKASNELITQPLYQSIVIRYVESCKHTFSRNFFCKSFVYNFFIWVKGTTTHINHTVTSSSVIFWKLSLFRYVLLWTKMVIIGGTHLKKIGKGENHKAYNQISTENNGVNSSHHQHFTFQGIYVSNFLLQSAVLLTLNTNVYIISSRWNATRKFSKKESLANQDVETEVCFCAQV